MAKTYIVQNGAMPTTAPIAGVTTSATLFTSLQVLPATNSPLKIIEWGITFNGAALGTPFKCDLVETGAVGATVAAFVAADVMPYDDPNAPANTAGTSGIPLNLGTAQSGYTSSAEGTITVCRVFDTQWVEPIGGWSHRFELGREPGILPGHFCRIRCHGDGSTLHNSYLVFEV
jgi:hypothetical protein